MYMHVSKPPKEGTNMNNFYKQLRTIAQKYENVTVEGVHKKINLADVQLGWEHERFSMKRMPGFTISSLKSHKDPLRSTIFVENEERNLQTAQRNAKIIAEALGAYVFGNNNGELFSGSSVILSGIYGLVMISISLFVYRQSQKNWLSHGCMFAQHKLTMT